MVCASFCCRLFCFVLFVSDLFTSCLNRLFIVDQINSSHVLKQAELMNPTCGLSRACFYVSDLFTSFLV